MRRIKVKQKKHEKPEVFFESKNKIIFTSIVVFVLVLIIGVGIYIENTDSKIVIKNKTDLKLEYVKAFYVGPEEQYNDGINETEIVAKETRSIPQDPIDLYYAQANLEIRFKFEGYDELFVDAGFFNDNFSGKVTIEYIPTDDGKIKLNVKAKSGIITSSLIDCDDAFTINLSEGYIED